MTDWIEQTYKEERIKLLNFIKSKISDIEDAEDILHDVFLQAIRNINVTQPIDNIMGWLFTVTRNRMIDWYRKKKYETISLQETKKDDVTLQELLADTGIPLEKEFMRSLVIEAIIEGLEELPEKQREIFLMQVVEGKTFKQISEATGTPINTLIARKRYAVMFLRGRLKDIRDVFNEI